jgi:hypothetical protein
VGHGGLQNQDAENYWPVHARFSLVPGQFDYSYGSDESTNGNEDAKRGQSMIAAWKSHELAGLLARPSPSVRDAELI